MKRSPHLLLISEVTTVDFIFVLILSQASVIPMVDFGIVFSAFLLLLTPSTWATLNTHTQGGISGALMRKQSPHFLFGTWDCAKTRFCASNLYSLTSCMDESSLHRELRDRWTGNFEVGSFLVFFLYNLRLTLSCKQLTRVLRMFFWIAFPSQGHC